MKECMTESNKSESNIPAIPNMIRDSVHKNSQENTSSDSVQPPLPRLDLPEAAFDFSEDREETAELLCTDEPALETPETNGQIRRIHQGLISQQERTLESQLSHLVIFTCKDTIAPGSVDYQLKMLNFKLYVYIKARLVQNMTNLQYFV